MFSISIIPLALSLAAVPDGKWSAQLGPCPRCVAAAPTRAKAPIKLPTRAVIYSWAGEFATVYNWWLIDLDSGQVTLMRTTNQKKSEVVKPCVLGPAQLASLRLGAAHVWRANWPALKDIAVPPPGAVVDAYVVSGRRVVFYNPFQPQDTPLTKVAEGIERACSASSS